MIDSISWSLIAVSGTILLYAFVGYPLALRALYAVGFRREVGTKPPGEWPSVTIMVPAFNEEGQIAETIEALLAVEYPGDRQILIVSDASSDGTDDIVRGFADRGVEFRRMPERIGKTELENRVASLARGDLIINTDASIRLDPQAAVRLVEEFADPTVGVATGRDVSRSGSGDDANLGEGGYVGLEMGLRDLESQVGGLIGASGSLYAIRRELHDYQLPGGLSRDFAAALVSKLAGFDTVSVPGAICIVPRAKSIDREYKRKVRTITRGMSTLWHFRRLLNPFKYPRFAWMLWSHKVARWLVPVGVVGVLAGVALQAAHDSTAQIIVLVAAGGIATAAASWALSAREVSLPKGLSLLAYLLASNVAVIHAWGRSLAGKRQAIWEPTQRS